MLCQSIVFRVLVYAIERMVKAGTKLWEVTDDLLPLSSYM